jgi:phosphoacetylglucosamine mutase
LVTTPQLHFIVQQANKQTTSFPVLSMDRSEAIREYHQTIGGGYLALRDTADSGADSGTDGSPGSGPDSGRQCALRSQTDLIVIDCSNGIGAIAVKELADVVNSIRPGALQIDLRNGAYAGPVNEGCGAEHVQKGQVPPAGVSPADAGQTLCSFDGDADRIVFHAYLQSVKEASEVKWALLDGDKIAAVLSVLISRELKEARLDGEFKMGVVQTAYANGASTKFLLDNGVTVVMAKTGVKYLHHKALEFDVGVYFEANGHGTVLLSEAFLGRIGGWVDPKVVPESRITLAMRRLVVSGRWGMIDDV